MTPGWPDRDHALRLFKERFFNRTDLVAILADWGRPCPIEATDKLDELLLGHLLGDEGPAATVKYRNRRGIGATRKRHRIGSYCPGPDDTTRWLCLDFDGAGHASALADPRAAAISAYENFAAAGLPAYLERSGGGHGWHLWCFFDPPLPAGKAQALGRAIAPKDAPLADHADRMADPLSGRGIEVFPKQARLHRRGFGNLVWLPWWTGAAEGGNIFCRRRGDGELEPYVPDELATAPAELVDQVLAVHAPVEKPQREPRSSALQVTLPRASSPPAEKSDDTVWAAWRKRALLALPLEPVYGAWLTGNAAGKGWLECRDPASSSGDQNPSAGVADGMGDAERGSFHSFISGQTISVFDFLVEHGGALDFRAAKCRVAELAQVPEPPTLAGPVAQAPRPKGRPHQIQINRRQLRHVLVDTWQAVLAANSPPVVFLRAGTLVRIVWRKDAALIEPMNEVEVYGHLARVADWVRVTEEAVIDTSPSKDVSRDMMAYPSVDLPPLDAVVAAPVFSEDGSLVTEPGYNRSAHLWYEPASPAPILPVPAQPSRDSVSAARALLLDELLGDFRFVDLSCRAHMVAAMFLPFVRRLIAGPTPIHLLDAPSEGTGKGLLLSIVSILATGQGAPSGTLPKDEDEIRKKIGAELSSGRSLVVFDNIDKKTTVDSGSLASAITAWPTWTDRILGQNKSFVVPNNAVWIITGNNLRLSRELSRRCISARIDSRVDRPWLRTEFRHPELVNWMTDERPRLVHAVLLLIQHWIAQGKPLGQRTLGSFERWARVMGGILTAVGIEGFLSNLDRPDAAADLEGAMWREFVLAWWESFREQPVRVSRLVELCNAGDYIAPIIGSGSERSQSTRLGTGLQGSRGRVFGKYRIEFAGREPISKRPTYRLALAQQGEATEIVNSGGDNDGP